MPSTWAAIDALVRHIGELSADVLSAEHTLATDPRTRAARKGLDRATIAVSTAIDERSESAVQSASSAIDETRALIGELGLSVQRSRSLVDAAGKLVATAERQKQRTAVIRTRLGDRKPKI